MNSKDFLHPLKENVHINLNEQQLAVVLAVPGSGKTTVVICRIVHLVLSHDIKPSSILSVISSRASAQDMDKSGIYWLYSNP